MRGHEIAAMLLLSATDGAQRRDQWNGRAYDPLVEVIAAHITLVFPFESELVADALQVHMRTETRGCWAVRAPACARRRGLAGA